VLTANDTVWGDFDQRKHHEVSERRLPVIVWSRLSPDLEPYLTERAAPGGTVISFFHRQLAGRAAAGQAARHTNLARYFSAQPHWLGEVPEIPNSRKAAELVYQEQQAGVWLEAESTLFDYGFLAAKCTADLVADAITELQSISDAAPNESLSDRPALDLLSGALG
jgi:hypothetical protein